MKRPTTTEIRAIAYEILKKEIDVTRVRNQVDMEQLILSGIELGLSYHFSKSDYPNSGLNVSQKSPSEFHRQD
jgi:hypothetical protein